MAAGPHGVPAVADAERSAAVSHRWRPVDGVHRPSRGVWHVVGAALLLGSCQPQTRRALLLDLSLSEPVLVAGAAAPWTDAGYTVEFRRFYPHLTRNDLTRYGTIILLGGRQPERWSDAVRAGDLALLTEWVPRGGVLVFGYAGAEEGTNDRWAMNRWLRGIGASIAIEDGTLADQTQGPDGPVTDLTWAETGPTPLDLGGPGQFFSGHLQALSVGQPSQVLARAPATAAMRRGDSTAPRGGAPVVAARRVGRGLVIVASRHLLGAPGAALHAPAPAFSRDSFAVIQRFLVALARWTRRPAEWARVPDRDAIGPIVLESPPHPVSLSPPPLEAPGSLDILRFPRVHGLDPRTAGSPTAWSSHPDVRGAWTRASLAASGALDSLLPFLDAAGLNALASPLPHPPALDATPPLGTPTPWSQTLARLGATSVRWFPIIDLDLAAVAPDACLLDDAVWASTVDSALRQVLTFARTPGRPVSGIVIEVLPATGGTPPELCDASVRAGLTRLGWDGRGIARLLTRTPSARYETLLESGILGTYFGALEAALAARAARSAAILRRAAPDLLVVLRSTPSAADWRVFGLARGFADDSTPVLIWDEEPGAEAVRTAFRERGGRAVHTLGVPASVLREARLAEVRPSTFSTSRGFWIGPIETLARESNIPRDSLAGWLRRLGRGP